MPITFAIFITPAVFAFYILKNQAYLRKGWRQICVQENIGIDEDLLELF